MSLKLWFNLREANNLPEAGQYCKMSFIKFLRSTAQALSAAEARVGPKISKLEDSFFFFNRAQKTCFFVKCELE